MTDFSKQTEMKARFDKGDVHSVNLSGGSYAPSLSIMTRTSDQVTLTFQTTTDLRDFMDMCISAAVKMDWGKEYSSAHVYAGENNDTITSEDVKSWREIAEKHSNIETVIEP